jgi:hypothetical protein
MSPYLLHQFKDYGTGKIGVSIDASHYSTIHDFFASPFPAGGTNAQSLLTTEQIAQLWKEVKTALAGPIDAGIFSKNETEHVIERPGTDQSIKAKTAWNADTLRGDYADLLILDEWQLMDETAWEDVGAPMLLDNNGDAVFVYTPPSLRSQALSRARDPRHAAKMFKDALRDQEVAAAERRQPYCEYRY